jgi:hypothetical protein
MAEVYPAGTTTIRNLTPRYNYFLVVKHDSLVDDIPQKEYFVYRYKVSVSSRDGITSLKNHFVGIDLIECRALSDVEYATGNFQHPDYTNSNMAPLTFKLRDIPIYLQSTIGIIDLNKDPYQYGSKPIINDSTSVILDNN